MTATPAPGPLRKRRPAASPHPPAGAPDPAHHHAPAGPHATAPTLPPSTLPPSTSAPSTSIPSLPRAAAPLPDEDPRHYLEHGARLLRECLPAATLERLARWRAAPTPWLELTGLPRPETEVPTPRTGFCDESLLTVPNLVHFGLLHLLGLEPVAYRWENHGRLVRNVAPSPGAARSQTSWGYATGLDWHTDDSVLDHRADGAAAESIPHFLSFYGMRNTERVPTWLLPVDEVLAGLPAATADALRLPDFDVTAPESYAPTHADTAGRPPLRTGVPLLWTLPGGAVGLRYGPGRVTGRTPAAREALARFEARIAACEGEPVMVEAGGFQIFDNRRVMHRRLPFEPAAADRARWLRRCYARSTAAA
ncbi:TauD/TfdA family dioxygenase [Streptomyces buecherae]|uniref:TauD/TfdA family dioxygenase n=2 Tax=Streptomyces buecherae TaxID=2763006 RepID=UPI0020B839E6|nr:TauD/TfdA family dioxygenase [Streptomyces buecherae]